MRKSFCVAVLGLLLVLSAGSANAQEFEMEKAPGARERRPPMPMEVGPMGAMMRQRDMGIMMQLMKDNPKLAGIMMQMRGELMRIRGEEMSKMGDVLKRYGERLEKELGK